MTGYDLTQLNEVQLSAVRDTEGAVLVLAGAGSGKTRVLTHRICHIIDSGLAKGWNILAITFTNKATNEMKERLKAMLGEDNGVWVSTFHSFSSFVLRKFITHLGYGQNFSIYTDSDRDRVLQKALRELHLDGEKIKDCIGDIISSAKNEGITPELLAQNQDDPMAEDAARLYLRYEELMKEANALDFDDLLLKTRQVLMTVPEALEYYQNKFRYVHVDEFQDTNAVQLDIVKLLAGGHGNVFVVGDDDQSIYGWRGADIRNILDFDKNFNAKIYKLEQNYRSTTAILTAANNVIKNNTERHEKLLFTNNSGGVRVEYNEAYNDRQEVDWVVGNIRSLKSFSGYKNKDFAILVRANSLTRVFEQRLNSERIGYRLYGGFKFFDRKEVQDVLAYLRILNNMKDTSAIERVINFPKRGIGDTTVQKLGAYARENHMDFIDVIAEIESLDVVNRGTAAKISEFYQLISKLFRLTAMPLEDAVVALVEQVGFEAEYAASGKEDDYNRWLNVQEFVAYVKGFCKDFRDATIGQFLETCVLVNERVDEDDDLDKVVISTMHMVKGLEFPVVFIVGCEENIFPSGLSLKEGEKGLQEERRIMYVAVTRAKERLYISCAKSRFMYNSVRSSIPSRFIREAKGVVRDEYVTEGYLNQNAELGIPSSPKPSYVPKHSPLDGIRGSSGGNDKKKDSSAFIAGQKVNHPKYGVGTILVVIGDGDNKTGTIFFPELGPKKFALATAPLTLVES